MKKNKDLKKENKELISLNSKILNEASIEELEERLELSAAGCWTNCPGHDAMYCGYVYDNPPPQE